MTNKTLAQSTAKLLEAMAKAGYPVQKAAKGVPALTYNGEGLLDVALTFAGSPAPQNRGGRIAIYRKGTMWRDGDTLRSHGRQTSDTQSFHMDELDKIVPALIAYINDPTPYGADKMVRQ